MNITHFQNFWDLNFFKGLLQAWKYGILNFQDFSGFSTAGRTLLVSLEINKQIIHVDSRLKSFCRCSINILNDSLAVLKPD